MDGKLRNMTGIYILRQDKVLLLYRQGGRVVNEVWCPSAGGHFEKEELNDARACVLRELKEGQGTEFSSNEGILRWFDVSELRGLNMPYTAKFVTEHYFSVGRFNDKLYGGIADGEKMVFVELL